MRTPETEVQKVAGEENVADTLAKNVKSEVLERHVAELGFTEVTRREMDDQFTGAHDPNCSQPVSAAKKSSASQKAVGALRNKRGGDRAAAAAAAARTAFQHYHAEIRWASEGPWWPTVGHDVWCVQ